MSMNAKPLEPMMSRPRVIAVMCLVVLLTEVMTFEIIMVLPALPHLARQFHTLDVAWTVTILSLVGATVQPLVGKAADRWGKKHVILALAVVFAVGSVICAVAPTFGLLIVGRALQGSMVGIVAQSYSLVRDVIPRTAVPVALGTVATGIGMAAVVGPFAAGWLIDHLGPQSIFWAMAGYVVVLLPLYVVVVPESPVRVDRPVDYLGTVLLGPGIALVLFGVSKGGAWGWTAPVTLALLLAGLAMVVGFVCWERVTINPLIDLKILFGRRFGLTVLAVCCLYYPMNAMAIISPTLLETPAHIPGISYGAGLSATQYALWTFPLGVTAMLIGPVGGQLARKVGARLGLILSGVLFIVVMICGTMLFTLQWQMVIMTTIGGLAIGFLHSSNANLMQDALPQEQGGVGNAIGGMMTMLAGGIATSVTGTIMAAHTLPAPGGGHAGVVSDSGLVLGYVVAGVVSAVGVVVALVMRHGRTPAEGGMRAEELTADRAGAAVMA